MLSDDQKIEILMSICAYTKGRWDADECFQFYYWLLEELKDDKKIDIKVIKTDGTNTH